MRGEGSHKDTSDLEYTDMNNDTDLHFVSSSISGAHYHQDSIDNTVRLCNMQTQLAVRNCIPNTLCPIETYQLLDDCGWFPESHRSFRPVCGLDHNHLIVHMSSPTHDAVANAWNARIALGSTNGWIGVMTLRQLDQGRMICVVFKLTESRVLLDCGFRKVA
jgi:hypothetical protein